MVVNSLAFTDVFEDEWEPLLVASLRCRVGEVFEFTVVTTFLEEVVSLRESKGTLTYLAITTIIVVVLTQVDFCTYAKVDEGLTVFCHRWVETICLTTTIDESVANLLAVLNCPTTNITDVIDTWCINHTNRTVNPKCSLSQNFVASLNLEVISIAWNEVRHVSHI